MSKKQWFNNAIPTHYGPSRPDMEPCNLGDIEEIRKILEASQGKQGRQGRVFNDSEGWSKRAETIGKMPEPVDPMIEIERILNGFVGMSHVKEQVKEWVAYAKALRVLAKNSSLRVGKKPLVIMLTGSPGTGKTELAKALAKIFYLAGLTSKDELYAVQTQEIVGKYVGHTGPETQKAISRSAGGTFFLDEAYRLASFRNDEGGFGLEALETILAGIDRHRENTAFIFAGYEDRMQDLRNMNEGFESRVTHHLKLRDYSTGELAAICSLTLKDEGYNLQKVETLLPSIVEREMHQGVLKGNGRQVKAIAQAIRERHLRRVSAEGFAGNIVEVLPEDLEESGVPTHEPADLKEMYKAAKLELDSLIGLAEVKKGVKRAADFQYIQQKRKEAGLNVLKGSSHMLFKGEPGTGKTTVARIVGKLYRSMGVLSNGHFVETSKSELIRGGNIPSAVQKAVRKAKGGVLFIDEAYTLASDGKGREALDALIAEMENHRDDLIVILAGYEGRMEGLFRSNEGLASRIPHHYTFKNYTPKELYGMAKEWFLVQGYTMDEKAGAALQAKIERSFDQGEIIGNGRWVRNLCEQILTFQSERLVDKEFRGESLTPSCVQGVTAADMDTLV